MMKHFVLIITSIVFILSQNNVKAQDKEQKKKDIAAYKEAEELAKKAQKAWKNENYTESEKLYYQSLKIYPLPYYIDAFAEKKVVIKDVKGAEIVWEALINRMAYLNSILVYDPDRTMITIEYKYNTSLSEIVRARRHRANANFLYGDIKKCAQELLALSTIQKMGPDEWGLLAETAIQANNFDLVQTCIDSLNKIYSDGRKKMFDMQLTPLYLSAKLALAKREFEKTIKLATELEAEDKGLNTSWKAIARIMIAEAQIGLSNIEQAKIFYKSAIKHIAFTVNSPDVAYVGGLIALAEKDYLQAIDRFNTNLNYKSGYLKNGTVYAQQKIYTNRANAYIGLKDYVHAKQDFEMALLYYADYEPALEGIAKLEGKLISERRTDKTAPVITVTEPSINRGLKVTTTGKDLMIKGLAVDQSGIKLVSINGTPVYTKEGGDFWGSVILKDGMNKLTIVATDLAGNTAEQVFEIEKQTASASTKNDIIPTTERKGKNIAVFIASQNYDDQSIPSLDNPISDAIKLKLILKNGYNFSEENIFTLFNPQRTDFKKKFSELRDIIQPEDNLILFYAGHGVWVEKEKKGYWLLTDAQRNDVNTWLPNKEVLSLISDIPARHTLLITDACFSGSVFKTRGLGEDAPAPLKELDEKISRVAITSGNDTEVPDESVFMKYLIKALNENKTKYLSAQKMFITQILEAVMSESKTEPRYGTLELAGHVGGDFIFVKK